MRAITTDIKALVGRLGPVAVKGLDLAIGLTMRAGGHEVTADHYLRALLDLPDCDLSVALSAANVARTDVGARLESHIKRLPGGHKGKPTLAQGLLLLIQDAAALTSDRVRTGHIAAALIADPSLSPAGIASNFAALPREPLHLLASRTEDRGEIGRILGQPATPATDTASRERSERTPTSTPTAPQAKADAPPPRPAAPASSEPRHSAPANAAALQSHFADRLVGADADGLTISARVAGRDTRLQLLWDREMRVLALRIALPGDPPGDEVGASVALSTLNGSLSQGTFVLDQGRIVFRSHVFLDAEGNAPVETVAYAVKVCEQVAAALGDEG